MKVILIVSGIILGLGMGFLLFPLSTSDPKINPDSIKTQVISRADTERESGDWGVLDKYTYDQACTHGTEDMFTAYVELLPGESVHPPHRHAEEEFLFIIDGTGVWTADGQEEFAAKSGDLLYASPWKWHGVQNTGTDTMTFFFLKWNNKGVAPPEEPEGAQLQ